ncbi:MAG: beta galactosidase jelly roll domain-containing protein [Acidobacteriota bacterium]|nr:beta galactosidase jelly roll domain-containing protein [Acidobacteriota bacterium]
MRNEHRNRCILLYAATGGFYGFCALFFSSFATVLAQAPPAHLLANVPARKSISLSGKWRSIVDPYETGLSSRYYENRKPKNPQDLVEYDFDAAPALNVPADWNSQRDNLFFYEGPLWYKTSFSYHRCEHTHAFLYFGAANYEARVYFNGEQLGTHTGGFTPFNFEITRGLRDGDNVLVVEVNNARHSDGIPALNTDWWNYGGLTRDVSIVEVPETYIEDYFVQLAQGSPREIAGWVKLSGVTPSQQVTFEIPETGLKQAIIVNQDGYADFHFPAKLQLWSPESPKLYRVVLSTASDRIEDEIGFRTIEVNGPKILLNGKPVFLRGISIHEEAPFRAGRAFSTEDDATLLDWAKELGCNFVRLAHYPHNEKMTRLADRLGLLVWAEIPVYWNIDWKNPATLDLAEQQMRELIARDHNHAAVILWSIANETPVDPLRLQFLKQLAAYTRTLDPTRLITAALNHTEKVGPNARILKDPVGEYLDVLGLNEYFGWYEGRIEEAGQLEWKSAYDKPIIVSEFGAEAVYGNHGAAAIWTEEFQARFYREQLNMVKKISSLAGMSPWLLMDYRSPRRPLVGIQDFFNRKGLISDRGQRKQAFYTLQKFYKELAASPLH